MKEVKEKKAGLPVKYNGKQAYTIYLEDSFENLGEYLKELEPAKRKACIVSDSTVWGLYGEQVQKILEDSFETVILFIFPAGEASKLWIRCESFMRY